MATESGGASGGHRAACDYCQMRGPRRSTLAQAEKDYAEHVKTDEHKRRVKMMRTKHNAKTKGGTAKAGVTNYKFRISGTNGGNLRGGIVYAPNVQAARSLWEKENPGYRAVKVERNAEAQKTTIVGM